MRIVWAGRGFGVVLHAEERQRAVAQAFQRLVVEVYVGQFHFIRVDRVGVDGEVVVVSGYLHLAGGVVANRVIAAMVAELKLVGLAAKRQSGKLMAEADSKDRHAAQELPGRPNSIVDRLRVARSVRQEDAVRFHLQHIFR